MHINIISIILNSNINTVLPSAVIDKNEEERKDRRKVNISILKDIEDNFFMLQFEEYYMQ